jgi:hypothetical protein
MRTPNSFSGNARYLRMFPLMLVAWSALALLDTDRSEAVAPPTAEKKLYGDQGGEKVEPADDRKPNTILRAAADDTFYKITSVRESKIKTTPVLAVEFEVTRRGTRPPTHIVIHFPEGDIAKVELSQLDKDVDRGVIPLVTMKRAAKGKKGSVAGGKLPTDAEFYFVRIDTRYGDPALTFKLSNSHVMGTVPVTIKARDWTAAEIARLSVEPPPQAEPPTPARPNPAGPKVGVETAFAGNQDGSNRRHVDDSGPMIGIQYRLGAWAGEKCLGDVQPIHRRDQKTPLPMQLVAKEGYAVSGAEVQYGKYVDAIKLYFRKVRADGTLDPADGYQSDWLGSPNPAATVTKLGDTGPRVLGISLRAIGVVDGLALVMEK